MVNPKNMKTVPTEYGYEIFPREVTNNINKFFVIHGTYSLIAFYIISR